MSEAKRHHYAPQFYLRNFACDTQKLKVEVVTKHGDHAVWSTSSIENLGYEDHYYVDPDGTSHENRINHFFESPLTQSSTWEKIVNNKFDSIDQSDRENLFFIIRQFQARTPHFENTIKELARIASEKSNTVEFENDEREFFQMLHHNPKELKAMLNKKSSFIPLRKQELKNCLITVLHSPVPLFTLTNPVVSIKIPPHPRIFLPSPDMIPTQLYIALSPYISATLVYGDFPYGFAKHELRKPEALGYQQHCVANFSYFPSIKHLIIPRTEVVKSMEWANYKFLSETSESIRFRRK